MIEHPYFLSLLFLLIIYLWFRNNVKFYFRHPHLKNLQGNKAVSIMKWQYFVLFGVVFLIGTACNFIWKTKESLRVYQVHKYVLVNDGSGSMVNFNKKDGIGNELTAILSGNSRLLEFLGNRKDGSKDLVGAIVFSDDAFIVSNFSDDPYFVQKKLKRIDYRLNPLAQGTNIEAGLWAGLEMLISHDNVVNQDELDHLQTRFYGAERVVKMDLTLDSLVSRKDKFIGSSIIIFTDGIFNANGSSNKMSSYKIINFCKLLGIRVYFISIVDLDASIAKYCRDTGGRGDVVNGFDKKMLEKIYDEIVSSQANEYIMKEEIVDRSLATWFGHIGLCLVLFGLLLHTTTQLNFTEV